MGRNSNYSRMPGFGDLPGDSSNPNSPDYVEPAFGEDDAQANVAARLVENDEVAELVADVAEARGLLRWIGANVILPESYRADWAVLERKAAQLERDVEREYQALNNPVDDRDYGDAA